MCFTESCSRKMIKGSEGLIYEERLKELNLCRLASPRPRLGSLRDGSKLFEDSGDPGESETGG